ncbi:MAG: TerB family tellurite resistance protein [Desulfococcaceae bacterium]|jgi:tellurite resistance protein TerB|nr:TerB family tellurite resistance protein [Desulfococcaceae bacterium]
MGLLDNLKKVKSRYYMEAIAAGCAMVAFADGIVRPEEVDKLLEYVRMDENLKVFESLEIIETFEQYIQQFGFDFQIGKEMALKAIRKVDRNTEEARLLILVCCAIGSADGEFDNNQRLVVREICRVLGMDHRRFQLNLQAPSPEDFPRAKKSRPKRILPRNIPEWMKNPPKIPASSPKPPRLPDTGIPDWMKEPPRPEKQSKTQENLPEWMKHPPQIRKVTESEKNMPEWMKDPPHRPDDPNQKVNLPEWMRNPPKTDSPAGQKGKEPEHMPEWMKEPRQIPASDKKGDADIPEWMEKQ